MRYTPPPARNQVVFAQNPQSRKRSLALALISNPHTPRETNNFGIKSGIVLVLIPADAEDWRLTPSKNDQSLFVCTLLGEAIHA